VFVCLSVC